jgi:hypothetical protein
MLSQIEHTRNLVELSPAILAWTDHHTTQPMQPSPSAAHGAADAHIRRALRVTTNLLAGLSLVLCVASVALCVRSHRVRDIIGFGRVGGNSHLVQSIRGRLHLLSDLDGGYTGGVTYSADRIGPRGTWHGRMSSYPHQVEWRLGFVWQTYVSSHFGLGQSYTNANRLIVVPYWFLAAVFALPPVAWLIRTRRRFGLLAAMLLVAAIAIVLAALRPPSGS